MSSPLPILAIRHAFEEAFARGPVVLSSPTGSGKSTEVPRWCEGPVLVVEPRRIACRSLAARVAELEGTELGKGVGYVVRDEWVASDGTQILFATPGMVLRNRKLLERAHTIILDEFHERSLDVDLLLSLLRANLNGMRLVVMSATLEGERVANYLGGVHLRAEGSAFPVTTRYLASGSASLPDGSELVAQIQRALDQSANDPGDVLVFLPGKAEIEACHRALRERALSLIPLHGGLSLEEQRRAFEPAPRRKVILATNVAETSLTIPGIGVVIDTGLVRQTRYHAGRGFLALVPIAEDSAAQRMGRAGRTAPGVCYRLWSPNARIEKSTPPELHRESLVPLILGAAAWGARAEELSWLDAPKPYALEAARADLSAWDALEGAALNENGRSMFALPVEPHHARLLVSARREGCLEDMIDLVAVLSVGRPLFLPNRGELLDPDDPRASGCDATATIRALRELGVGESQGFVASFVLREAGLARARLRRLEGLKAEPAKPRPINREALARAALLADSRMAHVARTRGKNTYFSNGGTEVELARESALAHLKALDAVVVLDTRAFGAGRDATVLITCGMAVPLSLLAGAGLGQEQVAHVQLERGRVLTRIERVYAKRVISSDERAPSGPLLRTALSVLLARGSLFREEVATTKERLARSTLAGALVARRQPGLAIATVPALDAWLLQRLELLGVEQAEDLAMLSGSDFLAPDLPEEQRAELDRDYPASVNVGDATYRAEYDLEKNQVLLHMVKGNRREPPKLSYLPRFAGLRICVESARGITVLRERGGR